MSDEDKEEISDVKTNLNFIQSDVESMESQYYLKGILIQIWKPASIFVFIWK